MQRQDSKKAREKEKAEKRQKRRERKEKRQQLIRALVTADPSLRRLVTESEAAALLATTPASLRFDRWAMKHGETPIVGLAFVPWGRRGVRYDVAEIEALIASRTVRLEPPCEACAAGGGG